MCVYSLHFPSTLFVILLYTFIKQQQQHLFFYLCNMLIFNIRYNYNMKYINMMMKYIYVVSRSH